VALFIATGLAGWTAFHRDAHMCTPRPIAVPEGPNRQFIATVLHRDKSKHWPEPACRPAWHT
jgi:hypothetical protein